VAPVVPRLPPAHLVAHRLLLPARCAPASARPCCCPPSWRLAHRSPSRCAQLCLTALVPRSCGARLLCARVSFSGFPLFRRRVGGPFRRPAPPLPGCPALTQLGSLPVPRVRDPAPVRFLSDTAGRGALLPGLVACGLGRLARRPRGLCVGLVLFAAFLLGSLLLARRRSVFGCPSEGPLCCWLPRCPRPPWLSACTPLVRGAVVAPPRAPWSRRLFVVLVRRYSLLLPRGCVPPSLSCPLPRGVKFSVWPPHRCVACWAGLPLGVADEALGTGLPPPPVR